MPRANNALGSVAPVVSIYGGPIVGSYIFRKQFGSHRLDRPHRSRGTKARTEI
ncbi:MAG TPA: hypothetical protein VLK82_03785 [Candidatus Tectomicrobia bacterium]|nr:hypothetical protein [Candidatus Tectomicrobia bacterium]